MEQRQSSLWVAAIAAIAGLVGAAIGRERWPADLRDARRLGEIVDKMETGTKEREFAAMYRDDLASRWIIGQAIARADFRRDLALGLMFSGCALIAAAIVVAALTLFGVMLGTVSELVAMVSVWTLVGVVVFAAGVWVAAAYRRRQDRYLAELRKERGMRAPVTVWMGDFEARYKQRHRDPSETATSAEPPNPTTLPAEDAG